jgi:signal transduction histidine kinase
MTNKDGSLRWLVSKAGVTGRIDGKPTRVTGTYADITERKESTRALRQANDRLVRVGRIAVIGEVTASIAHELSQPLTAITTNTMACQRMLDAGLVEDAREALDDVLHDSRRAGEILQRTRRLFDHQSTHRTSVNLNAVVRDVVKFAMPRLREFHVRLAEVLEPDLPDVHADAVQMQQVLFNLIVNATDAMNAVTSPRRHMRLSTQRGKRHVIVSVRDSGTGLDPADATHVFEPFFTTKPGGSGLGLAISRSIVQGHGGSLWAVANHHRGSTFRFKIPIPASRAVAEGEDARKILVVDHHGGSRRSLTRLLTGWGHHVVAAANAARAMAIVQTFRPDAVVIDVSMIGLALARQLRATSDRPLLLIAVTAHEDEQKRRECLAAGFDACVPKHNHVPQLENLVAGLR